MHSYKASGQQGGSDSLEALLKNPAQDTNRVHVLFNLVSHLFYANNDTADIKLEKYYREGLALATTLNNKQGIARFRFLKANQLLNLIRYEMAAEELTIVARLYKEVNQPVDVSRAYRALGEAYMRANKYAAAKDALDSCLIWGKRSGNELLTAAGLRQLAEVYETEENYPRSLTLYYQVLRVFEESGTRWNLYDTRMGIGFVYSRQGKFPEAIEQYTLALQSMKDSATKFDSAYVQGFIADCYLNMGEYEKAITEHETALRFYKAIRNTESYIWSYSNLGRAKHMLGLQSMKKGNRIKGTELLSAAYSHLKEALALANKTEHNFGISEQNAFLGNVCVDLGRFTEARKYFNEGIKIGDRIQNKTTLQKNYYGLSLVDSAMGDFNSAMENYRKSILYRDSLNNESAQKKSEQIKMEYEVAKKEDRIKQLATESNLKTAILQKTRSGKTRRLPALHYLLRWEHLHFTSIARKR